MSIATHAPRTTAPAARSRWAYRLSALQDALLIAMAAFFVYAHSTNAMDIGRDWHALVNVGIAIEQAMLVVMFLIRRRSRATSTRWIDWVVATGGWLPLLGRPADSTDTLAATGAIIQVVGLVGTCIAFCYLGRSFGVVAANRGLKVGGPYQFVRHPIYLTHAITLVGFVIANPTPWNLTILMANFTCQYLRIRSEERWLSETTDYAAYRERVRWRLVPGLY